jgi:replicative DNA helicase
MIVRDFTLQAEFVDAGAEQAVIAAVAQNPGLFWGLHGVIPEGAFWQEARAWQDLTDAIRSGQQPPKFEGWNAASDPKASAQRLTDLYLRRFVGRTLEEVAQQLYEPAKPVQTLVAQLEDSFALVRRAFEKTKAGTLLWAAEVLVKVMSDAEARELERKRTGKPVMGLPTGIRKLDEILGGLNEGLYILGGPPGVGKTSLALQMSAVVAPEAPVVYVTFENSAENLTLKAVCGRAGLNPQDVRRGTADLEKLRTTALDWGRDVAPRLAFIEGTSGLSVGRLYERALEATNRHKADRSLIVVDYLQLWAKAALSYRTLDTTRGRVETLGTELRELATRLKAPVLALSSQNRARGSYGDGTGKTSLDSLKESGDLEYLCDAALFLVGTDKRSATPPARAVELSIRKNRHGDLGLVHLIFRPDSSRFREEERDA